MNDFNEYEKLVDKWEQTGLLTECKDLSEKIQLSNILEEIADNLLHINDESDEFRTKAGIIIPLSVRIFNAGVNDIDFDKLMNIINELFPLLDKMENESYTRMDGEAEFTLMCADRYIEKYKDN